MGLPPSSFYNQSTIGVDFCSYLSYIVLISLLIIPEFSKCGPTTSREICFWRVLADGFLETVKNFWTKTLQGLEAKLRCPFLGSFLMGNPWGFKHFSRKSPSFNNIKKEKPN